MGVAQARGQNSSRAWMNGLSCFGALLPARGQRRVHLHGVLVMLRRRVVMRMHLLLRMHVGRSVLLPRMWQEVRVTGVEVLLEHGVHPACLDLGASAQGGHRGAARTMSKRPSMLFISGGGVLSFSSLMNDCCAGWHPTAPIER